MNGFIKANSAWLAPMASIGAFVVLWGLVSLKVNPEFLPSPAMVWHEFIRLCHVPVGGTSLAGHVGYSLQRVLIAFGLAVLMGLPLGLLMGWSRVCEKIVSPIFELLRPTPAHCMDTHCHSLAWRCGRFKGFHLLCRRLCYHDSQLIYRHALCRPTAY